MLGSPAGPGGASQRGLWPLAPAPSANTFSTDALSKYGVYSLFPGNPGFGSALYSHASIGRFASGHLQQTSANSFHTHKVSDSLFSTTGYTFGAPTPPPGSPYSPIPVAQLELLTKGYNNNIIIQPQEYPSSPKKVQIQEKRCDEKCCSSLKQKTCNCPVSPIKSASVKYNETLTLATGCSRTNPIDWNGVNVKKEPGTPCQVAEVTTSVSPIVKLEVTSPTQKAAEQANVINNSIIGPTEPASASMATTSGCNPMGGAILQCTDDRSTGLGGWQMGNAHSSALATPTVWQYPEPLQQAVVWPSYPQPPSVLLPSLQPPPLQLLSSASDYLSSSTTLHQHTQTHSTRLVAVTTDAKRKIPMPIPATTLIKIETDATTLDQTKTLQATPTTETTCRSQATSPVACLTPPPDGVQIQEEEATSVQDASNQTDTPICSEDDNTTHTVSDVIGEPKEKMEEADVPEEQMEAPKEPEPMPEQAQVPLEPEPRVETPKPVIEEIEETKEVQKPDLSGLELLSNSIVEFERNIQVEPEEEAKEDNKIEEKKTEEPLGGLDLLCALAEQRIMEEESTEVPPQKKSKERREKRREKRKSKKHSSDEPRRKKMKSERRRDEKKHREKRDSEKCDCQKDFRLYKTPETEEEVKKFIASKCQNQCCKAEWPHINPLELDMRMKLADLQRQYREKQKELNKLKPKKHHDCSKKKSRKKSTHSDRSLTPPPLLDKIDPVKPKNVPELLKPPTLCPYESLTPEKRPQTPSDVESSSSSSKKRKVGRPKKLLSSSGYQVATETIVAKKPKTNLVGYLLAAKEKLQLQNKIFNSPPRYLDETIPHKTKKARTINNNEIEKPKIGPKLKAEPMVKTYVDDWEYEAETEDIDEDEIEENQIENSLVEDVKPEDTRCTLTAELLEVDKLRVLTAMGGLFYAGHLNALEPPDVYSITLDGERGNKPHIMSREEILRDAIVEVSPKSTDDLPVGTRLCAYWSQQYRCLYPGSVAEPGTPDPHLDGKFVSVEFDDGDSGRIALEDIRFLPPDYPMIEYDPNPLLSLSKRRRRASTSISTEERRSSWSTNTESQSDRQSFEIEKENKDVNKVDVEPDYKETKKRLKKKKKEKMKDHEDKKKKKKHKCVEENCKHKKHHKKHKKHKKHHDKEREVEEIKPPVEEVIEEPEEQYPEYHVIANPDDEVTMDDIIESESVQNAKKIRNRQESCESRSKISAFLPANQLWGWAGKGYKRQRAKGRSKKSFYRSIQRGKELITVGDSAVFLSTGRPDRPYIGRIEAMWELCGTMVVRVKWFYHPEETVGCPLNLQYPGALFESPHVDENDVQTISHKCEVLPLKDYRERLGNDPQRYATIYDNNDIYYLAGYYDPTCTQLTMEPGIPFGKDE